MKKPDFCQNCSLFTKGELVKSVVKSSLSSAANLLIVVDSPKSFDNRILNKLILETVKGTNVNYIITGAILCNADEKINVKIINECKWHLEKILEKHNIDLIIACGTHALRALGIKASIERDRGKLFKTQFDVDAIITFHPSAVFEHGDRYYSLIKLDFEKAVRIISDTEKYDYTISIPNSTEELKVLFEKIKNYANSGKAVAFDIETIPISWEEKPYLEEIGIDVFSPYSDISTISFASGDLAIAFPVRAVSQINRILADQKQIFEKLFEGVEPDEELVSLFHSWKTKMSNQEEFSKRTYARLAVVPEIRKYFEGKLSYDDLYEYYLTIKDLYVFPISSLREMEIQAEKFKNIDEETAIKIVKEFCESDWKKVGHNLKFEIKFLKHKLGIEKIKNIDTDTMLLAYVENPGMAGYYNLQSLTNMYLPHEFYEYKKKYLNFDILQYNALDSFVTLKLAGVLRKKISGTHEKEKLFSAHDFLIQATELLAEVELNGFKLDILKMREIEEKIKQVKSQILEKIKEITGTDEVRKKSFKLIFYNMYEHDPIYTEKGELALNKSAIEEVLSKTENESLKLLCYYLLSLTKLEKIESSYIRNYKKLINRITNRIHPSFNLTRTETGRLSSSNPNFQQIPRDPYLWCPRCSILSIGKKCPICSGDYEEFFFFKKLIIPEPGNIFIAADYSQMEVRVLAEMSNDEKLIKVINDGLDLHSYSASKLFGISYQDILEKKDSDPNIKNLRQIAKSATFGILYGQTAKGLAEQFELELSEAERIIQAFFEEYTGVKAWIEIIHEQVKKEKKVFTPVGRVRRFNILSSASFREAQNFPIQSYASDITLMAAIKINELIKPLKGKVVGLVHDSIEIEVPKEFENQAKELVYNVMTTILDGKFKTKIEADVGSGESWAECE